MTTLPRFTESGFKKVKIPEKLYFDMLVAYNQSRFHEVVNTSQYLPEYDMHVADGSVGMLNNPNPFCLKATISPYYFNRWAKELQPILEEWSGTELEFVQGYGIRCYLKDSILTVHRDNVDTHVISCIIFLDEHPKVNWPLDFIDHDGVHHKVTFERGEMLLYESLCVHARSTPFAGEYYRNMYFHWRPVDWDYQPYINQKVMYKSIEEAQKEIRGE